MSQTWVNNEMTSPITAFGDFSARNLVTQVDDPPLDATCYLYRHFTTHASGGYKKDMYEVFVPLGYSANGIRRYAAYGFQSAVTGVRPASFGVAVPCTWVPHTDGSFVYGPTGAHWTSSADARWRPGTSKWSRRSATFVAPTLTITFQGSTVVLVSSLLSNGGSAVVQIDGANTNDLLTFTAADLAAGYCNAGDVGKTFIDCYSANAYYSEQILLAHGLGPGVHTLTITPTQISRSGATGDDLCKVYLEGILCAQRGLVPGASGVYMGYLKELVAPKTTTTPPAPPSITINLQDSTTWMGDLHGNEQFDAQGWYVDGSVVTPAADAWASGTLIEMRAHSAYNIAAITQAAGRILTLKYTSGPTVPYVVGEVLTQATSGATATFIYDTGGAVVCQNLTGTMDNSHEITGGTGSGTFTPTGLAVTFCDVSRTYSARASQPGLKMDYTIDPFVARAMSVGYVGMLNVYSQRNGSTVKDNIWLEKCRLGNSLLSGFTAVVPAATIGMGNERADMAVFYSDLHDYWISMYHPFPEQSLLGWQYASPKFTMLQDWAVGSGVGDKLYFTLWAAGQGAAFVVGQPLRGSFYWRVGETHGAARCFEDT